MKQSELKTLISRALAKDQKFLTLTEPNKDHPQVKELRDRSVGRVEVLTAVLDALRNDTLCLRSLSMIFD